jgi:two-component system, NarL family, nitrate/nitrite response regulator NarL
MRSAVEATSLPEKNKAKAIGVVIADDHAMVRDGLRRLLEEANLKVLGEAKDGMEAVSLVRQLSPQILLLDLAMPGHPGLEALSELHATGDMKSTRVIVLTADAKPEQIAAALSFGARGLVMKASATDMLLNAIQAVMEGDGWVGRERVSNLKHYLQTRLPKPADGKRFGVTDRELEIVSAVVSGRTNKQIAVRLSIAEDTVKHHLSNIFDKTGVSTRTELAMFAVEHKLPLVDLD